MNSLCLSPGDFFFYRQAHGVAFGKSDLLFLCLLKPKSLEIVVKGTVKVAAAKVCYECDTRFYTCSDWFIYSHDHDGILFCVVDAFR